MDGKRITISFPYDLWVKIRRMQEDGKAGSFQEEAIKALKEKFEKN